MNTGMVPVSEDRVMKTLLLVYTLSGVLKLSVPFQTTDACDRAAAHIMKHQPGHVYECKVVK